MFFKETNKPKLDIELPEAEIRRSAYRIEPNDEMPVALIIEGASAEVKNISSSGIAFYLGDILQPPVAPGHSFNDVHLYLGGTETQFIVVNIEVLQQDGNLFRCRMTPRDHSGKMALCSYIIERQKADIRKRSLNEPTDQPPEE